MVNVVCSCGHLRSAKIRDTEIADHDPAYVQGFLGSREILFSFTALSLVYDCVFVLKQENIAPRHDEIIFIVSCQGKLPRCRNREVGKSTMS